MTIPRHRPHRLRARDRGVTVVEFALLAPLALVLLIGIIISGIVAMNYVQLHNAVRDGARAAAVCGGSARDPQTNQQTLSPVTKLPNGQDCTDTNLIAYVKSRFQAIPGNVATLTVTLPIASGTDHMSQCQYKKSVEIHATYDQPLFLPLISNFLSNNGSGSTYRITATAEATCEI
jgi:Flp pilus assembly protein TadG